VSGLPKHLVIQRKLGNGSFGTVYLANDVNLGRPVAVKVLWRGKSWGSLLDPIVWKKFVDEAHIVANLEHPNVATVHELPDVHDAPEREGHARKVVGRAIVMEYLENGPLHNLRHCWPVGTVNISHVLEVMEQVADGVHHIHTAGDDRSVLVHRDLKPENILLDRNNRPHIVDFGLAALASDLIAGQELAAGTVPYMSPEQVRHLQGQPALIDSRSDIWSLGVILFEMLTGTRPFCGSRDEIMDAIENVPCAAPKSLNKEVSPHLDGIVRKCLSKNPDDRFQTAEQLAQAIHNCRTVRFVKSIYLSRLQKKFRSCHKRAVVLDTIEDVPDDPFLEQTAIESLLEGEQEVDDEADEDGREPRRGTVAELAREVRRLVLVGESGSGKSTTLQYYCCQAASSILQDPTTSDPCPIYLELRLSAGKHLLDLLAEKSGILPAELEERLGRGEFVLLLDGLNEVDKSNQQVMQSELLHLLDRFPDIGTIVSSRPGAYRRQLPLPMFRLQPLTDGQMEQFLERNCSTPEKGSMLVATLRRHPRLWKWGRNPMMLSMFACVGKQGGKLPANRAQLIRQFMERIFAWEAQTKPQEFDLATRERLLGEVAFATRMAGRVAFSRDEFFRTVKGQADDSGFRIDGREFLKEVVDNNLIRDDGETLAFVHELYQEYFAATALRRRYEADPEIVVALAKQDNWEEPLTLLYGLLESRGRFFSQMVQHNLIIAARCLASEDEPAREAVAEFENAINGIDLPTASHDQQRTVLITLCIAGNARPVADKLKFLQRTLSDDEIVTAICRSEEPVSIVLERMRTGFLDYCRTCKDIDSTFLFPWAETFTIPEHLQKELAKCWGQYKDAGISTSVLFCFLRAFRLEKLVPAEELECLVHRQIEADRLNVACRWVLVFNLTHKFPPEDLVRRLIKAGEIYDACQWVQQFGLTHKFPPEDLVRRLIKAGEFDDAWEWVQQFGLTHKFPPEDLVRRLIKAGEFDDARQWIEQFGLTHKFPPEDLVHRLIEAGEIYEASQWIEQFGLTHKFPLENLVHRLIEAGEIYDACHWVQQFGLTHKFPPEDLVHRLIEAGEIYEANQWIEQFGLTHKGTLEDLVHRLIEAGEICKARHWIEQLGLTHKGTLEDLVHRLIEAGEIDDACHWVQQFGLHKFPPEDLVRRLVEAGDTAKACRWVREFNLTSKFPPEDLLRRLVKAGDTANACRWVREFNLTSKFPPEDLLRRLVKAGDTANARRWAKEFGIAYKFLPASFRKSKKRPRPDQQ
jgi:serine/threonine protein kinase/predicted 3-demethylubiquinone-9 3-methyltransferase (glyoxalase superfamily)